MPFTKWSLWEYDEWGRPRRGPGIVYEPCPLERETVVNVCPSCGGEMVTEPVGRVTYCPRCTLPPPHVLVGVDEDDDEGFVDESDVIWF